MRYMKRTIDKIEIMAQHEPYRSNSKEYPAKNSKVGDILFICACLSLIGLFLCILI